MWPQPFWLGNNCKVITWVICHDVSEIFPYLKKSLFVNSLHAEISRAEWNIPSQQSQNGRRTGFGISQKGPGILYVTLPKTGEKISLSDGILKNGVNLVENIYNLGEKECCWYICSLTFQLASGWDIIRNFTVMIMKCVQNVRVLVCNCVAL